MREPVFIKVNAGRFSFGDFPREIRDLIYEFYHATDKPHTFPFKADGDRTLAHHEQHLAAPIVDKEDQGASKPNQISLLLTCHAAHAEGSTFLFKDRTLHIVNIMAEDRDTMMLSGLPRPLPRKFRSLALAIFDFPLQHPCLRYLDHTLWDVIVDNFKGLDDLTIQCEEYLGVRNLALRLSIKPKCISSRPQILFKLSIILTTPADPVQADCVDYIYGERPGKLTQIAIPAVKKLVVSSRIVPVELDLLEKANFNSHYLMKVDTRKYVQDWQEHESRCMDGMIPWTTSPGTELIEHTFVLTPRLKIKGQDFADEIDQVPGLRYQLYVTKEKLNLGGDFTKALRGFKF